MVLSAFQNIISEHFFLKFKLVMIRGVLNFYATVIVNM